MVAVKVFVVFHYLTVVPKGVCDLIGDGSVGAYHEVNDVKVCILAHVEIDGKVGLCVGRACGARYGVAVMTLRARGRHELRV